MNDPQPQSHWKSTMSILTRLQAIEHDVQCLGNQFRKAADRGRDHGNKILSTLTRIERKLALHTDETHSGYKMLNNRIDENNRRILQVSSLAERLRTATTTPKPDPETDTPEKHLLPIRPREPISIDADPYID